MMKRLNSGQIQKLKKYLFLISILFLISTFSHVLYTYLYNDSILLPEKGGTISEGFIGEFPSLNPLKPLKGNNKYIVDLLYRSIMKYDIENEKIVSDLATCDTSNLLYIDCYIKDNIKWSNGQPITNQDILATYKLLQNTDVNPVISSLLSETVIGEEDNHITFSNTKKDINFLNIFFQPILSEKTIEKLSEEELGGNFKTTEQKYSGDFILTNVSRDETIGITKIILEKNPYNENEDIFIDTFILKFFANTNDLLKNKETINIFYDEQNIIGESVPRLKKIDFTLPQYVSLFINKNNIINREFRNSILNKIKRENLLTLLGEKSYKEVKNPYLTDTNIDLDLINKNFEDILNSMGYQKKSKLLEPYIAIKNQTNYSEEVTTIEKENTITPALTLNDIEKKSKIIIEPTYIDSYNFISKDDILFKGIAGNEVTSVYINDYKLTGYGAGDKFFYYRIKESFKNLVKGKNEYNIYFTHNGSEEKVLQETITIFYDKDTVALELSKTQLLQELQTSQDTLNNEKTSENKPLSIDKVALEEIQALDENYFYNDKNEILKLNLFYIASDKDTEKTAQFVKDSLEEVGIQIDISSISMQKIPELLNNKNGYDMIIGGVNLGYFESNIFPYFHSSQEKNGYNFSNLRKTILDDTLEEIKSKIHSSEYLKTLEDKVLDILKDEQVVKTLYTPSLNLLIDKNMNSKGLINNSLPKKSIRSYILKNTYIKEKKIINMENKGLMNFIGFLLTRFYDPSTKK